MQLNFEEIFSSKNFQLDPLCKRIPSSNYGSRWQKKRKPSRQLECTQIELNGQASSKLQTIAYGFRFINTHTRQRLQVSEKQPGICRLNTDIMTSDLGDSGNQKKKKKLYRDLQIADQDKECILKYLVRLFAYKIKL